MDSIDMDPYSEDKAERIYLKSKPTCFIIVGKPGCGKSVLAKNLSKVWKCELINGTEVVNMAIEMQTELGTKAQEILLRGEAIPEELASKLMMEKINSPEVAHHGYILDGFPSLCEDWLSLADQLELVKNLPLTPDFIINIKIPDKDLEIRRRDQKLDPLTGMLYTKSEYDPEISAAKDKDVGGEDDDGGDDDELEDEEEEEEILEEEIEYPEDEEREEIGPELLARLVTKPEDLPQNITSNIKHYKEMVLRSLEDYMADHDPQKLIELDGNENQRVLFKSLMTKLNTFVLNRALIPLRLQGSEDADEIGDDTDSDDLLRTLAATEIVAPKFRWRRSKWGRNCPVLLKDGNTVLGGAQFSVSFLDKMYVMSSTEALGQFMRNPRPYLASHLPRPPCKLCVLGPPHSGKTEVAQKLAERYNAQVLVMDELIKPRREAAKKKMLEEIKDEAVQSAISKVTAIRQSMMTEKTEEEDEGKEKAGDEDEDDEEKEEEEPQTDAVEEGKISEEKEEEIGEEEKEESEVKSESGETKPSEDDSEPAAAPAEQPRKKSKEEIPIDTNHPDVIKIVNDVMAEAEKKEPDLNTDDYVEALEEAVQKRAEELLAQDPDGPSAGGYVIDDFPRSREHFSAMIERGLIPDEVVCLRDESENGEFLLKRWYATNKQELHAKWETRRAAKLEKIRAEKERLRREEEQRQAAEEARKKAEEEAKLEAGGEEGGEESGEVGGEEGADKDTVEGDEGASTTEALATEQKADDTEDTNETASPDIKVSSLSRPSDEDLGLETEEELRLDKDTPPETPETEEFRRSRTNFERDFVQLLSVVKGTNNIEPINVSVEKELETIATEVIRKVEAPFNYRAWEYTGMDQDEEEEDAEGDEEDDDDEEGGDPFNRERKKIFGDTKYYCPVLLKENNTLIPGLSECAAKYRERTYFFSSVEARAKFLDDPDSFLSKDQPLKKPPTRLLIVGPKGSGKTLHGRYLAMKLGVFHISFTERLQELIIAKTKKKIGPEYEEDEDEQGSTEENVLEDIPKDLEDDEGNKEQEVELTDDEENIKSNLAYGEPLASETLDKILPAWWNEEPFRSTGFIIEGFPRNELESRYLANSGLFPDATVMLAVEDNDIVNRLLPPLLEKWKKKRDKRVAEKERLKALARQQKLELRARRREEKLAEIAARKAERQARKQARESDDSDDEAQDAAEEEEDIEALMDAEFEEEEEEEDDDEEEETEEDAIERMKTEIGDRYDEEVGRLSVVQETLEELLIPRLEINAGRKPRIVRFCIEKSIQSVVEFRDCLFERCFPIDSFLANRMINNGYRFPSRFGRWCPVKLLEGEVIQPQYGGGGGLFYPCPVVYRQHIYFCCNDKTRDEFMQNPIKYLKQPSPKPVVPIRIAITGPPKSGKTALAKRFASEYGVIRLSIGEALRRVLDNQKHTELARQINIHLRSGNTVPDELAVQSLEIALLDMQCQIRGFVLDGYPLTLKQVQLMTDRKIIPVKVLELTVDDEEVLRRGMADRNDPFRTLPLHDSHQILAIRLNCWQQEVGAVRDWYCNEHRNWVALDSQRSKWWVWSEALDEARKSVRQIQVYLDRISAGKSASISNMCITQSELLSRLGDFGQYCPVSLADRGELVDCSTNPSLQLAAEFRGRYYKMGTRADLEKFLAEPARYVPPLAPRKLPDPEMLPRRRTSADVKAMFPAQIEMQGYCPVTYWDGKQRYENIVAGNPELVVEYRKKLHYFASEEKLDKFMRLPELYYGLKLPHKLPPPKDPALSISSLPMLGFMEQTVSTAITKSLTAVGCFKPKYPFLDAKRSALTYVAYHLKAYNPNSSDFVRKKYKQKLMQFEEQCELIQYLGKEMTSRYRQPDERPIDFDHKLNNFLSLKGMQV